MPVIHVRPQWRSNQFQTPPTRWMNIAHFFWHCLGVPQCIGWIRQKKQRSSVTGSCWLRCNVKFDVFHGKFPSYMGSKFGLLKLKGNIMSDPPPHISQLAVSVSNILCQLKAFQISGSNLIFIWVKFACFWPDYQHLQWKYSGRLLIHFLISQGWLTSKNLDCSEDWLLL